jgi:hypothetical protein
MRRAWWAMALLLAGAALVLYDVDLLRNHLPDVQGNLEASVIWGTPAALLLLWHTERRHRQREAAADARHSELLAAVQARTDGDAEMRRKIDEIHALHLHGTWPEDRHRGRPEGVPDGDSPPAVA